LHVILQEQYRKTINST